MQKVDLGINSSLHCFLLIVICWVFTFTSYEVATSLGGDARLIYLAVFGYMLLSLHMVRVRYATTAYEKLVTLVGLFTVGGMGSILLIPGTELTSATILSNELPARYTGFGALIALLTWVLAVYVRTPRLGHLLPFKRH